MFKKKELLLYIIVLLSLLIFGLISVLLHYFPNLTQSTDTIFSNSYYLKKLFTDEIFLKALLNTYSLLLLPDLIFLLLFAIVKKVSKKVSRKVFYISGCVCGSFVNFLFIIYNPGYNYYYYPSHTIVFGYEEMSVSTLAKLFSNVFFSSFVAVLVMFLCWIFEMIFYFYKNRI